MSKYTGTFPNIKTLYTHADLIAAMNAWAKKIAGEKYHYVTWKSNDTETHTCPICEGRKYNDHFGWNCIGFAFAVWHHGGNLKTKCSCHVISNEQGEKIARAKTDAEALKFARSYVGTNDIKVIRNKGKNIAKSKLKAGDICLMFKGNTYKHTWYYMGDGKVADSTGSGSVANNIAIRKYTNYTARVVIRYTGKANTYRMYLKKNDSGEEVKNLQRFLNWSVKSGLVIDGEFGDKTDAAVKAFQKKCNLTVDGFFGEASLKAAEKFEVADPVVIPTTTPKTYTGVFPTITIKKTNAEVINDAVTWASWIAGDNSFHYGYTNKHGSSKSKDWHPNAHHNGCYFCGTNTNKGGRSKDGIVDFEKTYCCNPFVGAAWAHGGCVPKAIALCRKGSSWSFEKGGGYDTCSLFKKLGHPAKSKLKKGDVLCRSTHIALYIGNGKIAEAGSGDDNKKGSAKWNSSIRITTLTDSNYKKFPRVYRFNSSVNTTMAIRHGEVSERVRNTQKFLNWYFGVSITVDGLFGDITLKYVKAFQKKEGLTVDGVIGEQTIAKMKTVKR